MAAVLPFATLLERRLRDRPGNPFLTFYDDATGERTELSGTTYANWVAKTANLLVDEYGLEQGDHLQLALPTHWLSAVFLGAAWYAGLTVGDDSGPGADLVVTGPASDAAPEGGAPVLACSLLPFAVRFPTPPPAADDFGLLWPGQPDAFLGVPCTDGGAPAWSDRSGTTTLADLATAVAVAPGARILTDWPIADRPGAALVSATLIAEASLVLVTSPAPDSWESRAAAEQVTETRRGPDQPSAE